VDGIVGENTWNLLVSGCNSSLATQLYGLDIGWPEGVVDATVFQCLYASGFRFVILECFTECRAGLSLLVVASHVCGLIRLSASPPPP
jgi:hypothetical protein